MARAFKRSSKVRPLNQSNMLFFPTCHEDHWFVFIVDIKDRKYVMLDLFLRRMMNIKNLEVLLNFTGTNICNLTWVLMTMISSIQLYLSNHSITSLILEFMI